MFQRKKNKQLVLVQLKYTQAMEPFTHNHLKCVLIQTAEKNLATLQTSKRDQKGGKEREQSFDLKS